MQAFTIAVFKKSKFHTFCILQFIVVTVAIMKCDGHSEYDISMRSIQWVSFCFEENANLDADMLILHDYDIDWYTKVKN